MRMAPTGLALLSALAFPLSAQTYTDPSTGVEFPMVLTAGDMAQSLMGTGVRTRTFLKVKVYAFGFYVEPAGAKTTLAAWSGKTSAQLQGDPGFYAKILEHGFAMTMRLVMTRGVDGETMAEAFDEALRPRVIDAGTKGMAGGEASLDQFRGFFSDKVENGTEIVLSCTPAGHFATKLAGQDRPVIDSPALCWALFDVYLGAKPISSDGKKTAIANFPSILQ